MKRKLISFLLGSALLFAGKATAQEFQLTSSGYFKNQGVDVMAFDDIYPEGHQGGVCIIMNGNRIATNGDIRLEATPGQWQPVPKQLSRKVEDPYSKVTIESLTGDLQLFDGRMNHNNGLYFVATSSPTPPKEP